MSHPVEDEIRVEPLGDHWDIGDRHKLADALGRCPDVAFAYLAEVEVPGQQAGSPVVFVWLHGTALRSLRGALNLVSETVARVIPGKAFVDVVILNSAPDLLARAEDADALFVESDPEERARALQALSDESSADDLIATKPGRWWWPF